MIIVAAVAVIVTAILTVAVAALRRTTAPNSDGASQSKEGLDERAS